MVEVLRAANRQWRGSRPSFSNIFLFWTASIDFNGLSFHDFLIFFSLFLGR